MSIENIGLQEITLAYGAEIPSQMAVQGDSGARGLSMKLLGANNTIIQDPLIQVEWNFEMPHENGMYALEYPVRGRYNAGRYEVLYPEQLGQMTGIANAQVTFKQGSKTLVSIPYKIKVYKRVGEVGTSVPPGMINIFDQKLAEAMRDLNKLIVDAEGRLRKIIDDSETGFQATVDKVIADYDRRLNAKEYSFNQSVKSLENQIAEVDRTLESIKTESDQYMVQLQEQGDKAIADMKSKMDSDYDEMIDELQAQIDSDLADKQAQIDSVILDLENHKQELEDLESRLEANMDKLETDTNDLAGKIDSHIESSQGLIDSHIEVSTQTINKHLEVSTQKIDAAIANLAGSLDDDIEKIVSEKVDEFADGLSERVTKTEADIVELETDKADKTYVDDKIGDVDFSEVNSKITELETNKANKSDLDSKADKSELEGLAKETYVDEKISEIPEVDLTDIENDISGLKETKADKEEMPKYGNDLKVSEGWEVPLGSVVEGLNNFKADKTELDNKADKSDLIGLATEKYVDDKISENPEVDLTDIENDISSLKTNKADKTDMTSQLSLKADKSELNKKADKTELTPINKEIDNLKSSGVESNRIMVEALNSKGVQASIDNSIRENATKISDIPSGDYNIGDICKRVEEVWTEGEDISKPTELWVNNDNYGDIASIGVDIVSAMNVYSGDVSGIFRRISPEGRSGWTMALGGRIQDIYATDFNLYLIVGDKVVQMDLTGKRQWTSESIETFLSNIACNKHGDMYVGGAQSTNIYKVSAQGDVTTLVDSVDPVVISTLQVDDDNNIYAGGFNLTKWNGSGTKDWEFRHGMEVDGAIIDSYLDEKNSSYLVSDENYLTKVSSDGKKEWTIVPKWGKVQVVDSKSNDVIYIGTSTSLVKLDTKGNMQWVHNNPTGVLKIGIDGHAYTANDNNVKKIKVGTPPKLIGYKILE